MRKLSLTNLRAGADAVMIQEEILCLLDAEDEPDAAGLSSVDIAERTDLPIHTVRQALHRLRQKGMISRVATPNPRLRTGNAGNDFRYAALSPKTGKATD